MGEQKQIKKTDVKTAKPQMPKQNAKKSNKTSQELKDAMDKVIDQADKDMEELGTNLAENYVQRGGE